MCFGATPRPIKESGAIDSGKLETGLGTVEHPDATIDAPFEVWMDILTGEASGPALLAEGKYTIQGDMMLLDRLKALFR